MDFKRPIPCMNMVKEKGINDQLKKISQEMSEVWDAYAAWMSGISETNEDLAEELTDVITAATTALQMLGCDAKMRTQIQVMVNQKNYERGYFNDK